MYVIKSMVRVSSQLCGDSLLAVFLSRQDGAIYRQPEHSQMSHRLNECNLSKSRLYGTDMNCYLLLYLWSGGEK